MNKRITIIISTTILLVFVIITAINNKPTYDYNIHIFSVGKADAILISKDSKYIMIDTATENMGKEIMNYLSKNNIKKIDYLIITHFDEDHIGSAARIIDNIEIGGVLQSSVPKESVYYYNYLNSLNNKSIEPKTITDKYNISIDNIDINVYGTEQVYSTDKSNNSSLITTVKYNKYKFLFMGDAENPRIKEFLDNDKEIYDFIKVPYHGKYLKNLDELLDKKKIKYSVITSSDTELESKKTIESMNNHKIKYYLTRKGSIDISSNGEKLLIKQKRNDSN